MRWFHFFKVINASMAISPEVIHASSSEALIRFVPKMNSALNSLPSGKHTKNY
jgi:hypothetical protein